MSDAIGVLSLRVGDLVCSRVTGNPYCKDRATGEVVKLSGEFARIRLRGGLEIAVKREWIESRFGSFLAVDLGSEDSVTVNHRGEIMK